jgi:hypothetical protein
MRRPLVVFALIFSCGIIVASKTKITFPILYAFLFIFLILSVISFKKKLLFDIIVCFLIFILGAVLFKNYQLLP